MATTNETQRPVATCPDCGRKLTLKSQAELGRRLTCLHCGVELKVIETHPLRLGKAYSA